MKIGVWHNTGAGGGARRHLFQHVKGLTERGHEVVSCCPEFTGAGEHDIGQLVHEERIEVPGRFDDRRLVHGRWNYNRALHDAMEAHCKQAAAYLNDQNIELLLATNCGLVSVPAIAHYIKAPSLAYIHDPWRAYHSPMGCGWEYPEALTQLPWLSYWGIRERLSDYIGLRERRIFIHREMRNAAAFDQLLTNSYFCRESILSAYRENAMVCYQGIDTNIFVDYGISREPFVLGIGSFWVHKGIDFIIHALAKCKHEWPLVWIGNSGSTAARDNYVALARQMGINMKTLVNIDDKLLVEYYNRASLLLGAARMEPFGLTPLEANACGLPVLAVCEGGYRETVQNEVNGRLVDKNEVIFAAAIDDMMSKPSLLADMGAKGKALVHDFWTLSHSIDRLEHQVVQVHKQVTGHSR